MRLVILIVSQRNVLPTLILADYSMAKSKIKWLTFTDNKEWGRYFIGESDSYREAIDKGKQANKGKFVVERRIKWK